MTRTRLGAATLLAVALPLLEACGGEAPAAATPAQPVDLSTPEGALAAVEDAEHTIDQLVGAAPKGGAVALGTGAAAPSGQASAAPAVQPSNVAPPPPPAPAAAPPAAEATRAQESTQRASKGDGYGLHARAPDPCAAACAALASMERATEHLCALAGAGDARCSSARDRVKGAGERVRAACPACAG